MSKAMLVKKIKALKKAGFSFREIEARFPVSLGAGNGTKALRLSRTNGVK